MPLEGAGSTPTRRRHRDGFPLLPALDEAHPPEGETGAADVDPPRRELVARKCGDTIEHCKGLLGVRHLKAAPQEVQPPARVEGEETARGALGELDDRAASVSADGVEGGLQPGAV